MVLKFNLLLNDLEFDVCNDFGDFFLLFLVILFFDIYFVLGFGIVIFVDIKRLCMLLYYLFDL